MEGLDTASTPALGDTSTNRDTGDYVATADTGAVSVHVANLTESWSTWQNDEQNSLIGLTMVADHNGDGVDDVFAILAATAPDSVTRLLAVSGAAKDTATATCTVPTSGYARGWTVSDHDGDDRADLLLDSLASLPLPEHFLAIVNGPCEAESSFLAADAWVDRDTWPSQAGATYVGNPALDDVTGDGLADLILYSVLGPGFDRDDILVVPGPLAGAILEALGLRQRIGERRGVAPRQALNRAVIASDV